MELMSPPAQVRLEAMKVCLFEILEIRILNYVGAGQVVAHGEGVEFPAIGSNVGIKYAADACLTCGK